MKAWFWSLGAVAGCTLAGIAMAPRFDLVNVAMVYVLAVVVVALRFTRGPAIFTALLSVLAFDVLFVPPRGTLTVDDAQYLLTFAIMLTVALVISRLTESARRQASERARLAVEAEAERIRSTLLSSISHDLRTPLAVIAGASSSLVEGRKGLRPDEAAALARSIFERSREMSEHVDKILQMTRLELGAVAPERDWCSVEELAAGVLEKLRDRLRHHRVTVEIPADVPLVEADAALVEQALANLLENAARHTAPGTAVCLRILVLPGELQFSVEDFACAEAGADLEQAFAKFERGRARESSNAGVGLGLSICKAIVELHGGKTRAKTLPMGGKAFSFTLPLGPAPAAPAERSS